MHSTFRPGGRNFLVLLWPVVICDLVFLYYSLLFSLLRVWTFWQAVAGSRDGGRDLCEGEID